METITEAMVQSAIYDNRKLVEISPIMIPNAHHFSWESDVLMVMRSGCLHEYEIKLSVADFRADFQKTYRHFCMKERTAKYPAHFWYVCPEGIIPVGKVPEYAGLAYMSATGSLRKVKPAPRLAGSTKISEKALMSLLSKMTFKYWKNRRRNPTRSK